jgi:hypothetical protein
MERDQGIGPKVAKYGFNKEIKSGMNKWNEIGFGCFNSKEEEDYVSLLPWAEALGC